MHIHFLGVGGTLMGHLAILARQLGHRATGSDQGVYPPMSGDPGLTKALAPYAGPKGNLKFPLDQPFPYALLKRIVRHRVKQDRIKKALASE